MIIKTYGRFVACMTVHLIENWVEIAIEKSSETAAAFNCSDLWKQLPSALTVTFRNHSVGCIVKFRDFSSAFPLCSILEARARGVFE